MLRRTIAMTIVAVALLSACGSDDSSSSEETTTTAPAETTTTAPVEPLQILVTDDDGIGAPGIDALVNAVSELDDV